MSALDRLESKFGKLKLPNLIYVFVGAYVLGYVISFTAPFILNYLCFDPERIFHGQVWRLFTFITMTQSSSNVFMVFITCFIYISIAKALERIIGRFRINFFLVSGWLMLLIFGFLFYFIMPDLYAMYVVQLKPYYLLAMLFVLFAMIFPDARFLLMFIIPIKGRWMIFITLALYALDVIQAFSYGIYGYGWVLVFMIVSAILTLLLFLYLSGYRRRSVRRPVNIRAYRSQRSSGGSPRQASEKPFRHKCVICGRTDISNPELDFRYCTKCAGNYEYCSEHLYTHIHRGAPDSTV